MKAVEKYYSIAETALLLSVCTKTVLNGLKRGDFGTDVVDLARTSDNLNPPSHDYRIPASGINGHLSRCRLFTEPGIAARNVGELRRKAACPDV